MVDLGQKKVEFIPPFFMDKLNETLQNTINKLFFSILTRFLGSSSKNKNHIDNSFYIHSTIA